MRVGGLVAALAIAGVLAACALAISPSPCRGAVTDPAEAPTHHDPELEARFPDTVGGQALEVQSICANAADPGGVNMAPEFLEEVGVAIDDVTYAVNGVGLTDVSVTAFRYRGADEGTIRAALNDAMRGLDEGMAAGTRAGKDVDTGQGLITAGVVFYTSGDTLYVISGTDERVDELLAGLP